MNVPASRCIIESQETQRFGTHQKYYFFSSETSELLAYIRLRIHTVQGVPLVDIIDTTSAGGVSFLQEDIKKIYESYGYKKIPGFGQYAFEQVIRHLKKNIPKLEIVCVHSYESSQNIMENLLQHTKQKSPDIIANIGGGNDSSAFTLYLQKTQIQ